jgi:predicted ATPase/predicted Ser/Thr protein kinase
VTTSDDTTPDVPERIAGRYRVERLLGKGGMGSVYLAEQEPLGRRVALKVLVDKLAADPTSRERFLREARSSAQLNHANVATIYDFGESDDGLYLAMEYIEGRSLDELIEAEGPLSWERALHLVEDVCRGLADAHDKGIAHFDIKPQNILVTEREGQERAVLVDFGLARAVNSDVAEVNLTSTGAIMGTPRYISPEQIRGVRDDLRSDLYSLGAVLFEMMTGQAVFDAETPALLVVSHLSEAPRRPSVAGARSLPETLDDLVLRLLAKDPTARPDHAGELLGLLKQIRPGATPAESMTTTMADFSSIGLRTDPTAPSGDVVMMSTEIEDATKLWAEAANVMREAERQYELVLRETLAETGGYEASVQGGRFTAAFNSSDAAVRWALRSQERLFDAPWSRELLEEEGAREEDGVDGQPAQRGLRVAIGLTAGAVEARPDPRSGRMDYFGPTVERARGLAAAAHGGQILTCVDVAQQAAPLLEALGAQVSPLGSHRPPGMPAAAPVVEVLPARFRNRSFAALNEGGEVVRTNLPEERTRFVGRDDELAALRHEYDQGARLVTLLGPGGTGKTRLSQRLGRAVLEESDDLTTVWFVDLTTARTTAGVFGPVAKVLGVSMLSGDSDDAAIEHLASALRRRGDVWLIFDNAEQVIEQTSKTVARLLEAAPGARILITSREPLGLGEEVRFELPPLDDDSGLTLFLERARQVARRTFTEEDEAAAREVVKAVDGMPLAIELAAARAALLKPAQILERLTRRFDLLKSSRRDLSGRQATLRGAIDWSWDLLDETERDAFAQASAFAGGFTVDAAEAVIDLSAHEEQPFALDVLQALRDKSLIRLVETDDEPRFTLYVSLREYAAERLEESGGSAATRRRHGDYFISLGEELEAGCYGPRATVLRDQLRAERENLLEVWRRFRDDDPLRAARARMCLGPIFEVEAPIAGQVEVFTNIATLAQRGGDPRLEARAWVRAGGIQALRGDVAGGFDALEKAIALAREIDDKEVLSDALRLLGRAHSRRGQLDETNEVITEALMLAKAGGYQRLEAHAENALAVIGPMMGYSPEEALAREHRALDLAVKIGDRELEARVLSNLGVNHMLRGLNEEARGYYERALAIELEMNDQGGEGLVRGNLGSLLVNLGEVEEGRRQLERAVEIHRDQGATLLEGADTGLLATAYLESGEYDVAGELIERALEITAAVEGGRERAVTYGIAAVHAALIGDVPAARAAVEQCKSFFGANALIFEGVLTRVELVVAAAAAKASGEAAEVTSVREALERLRSESDAPILSFLLERHVERLLDAAER